MRKGATKIKMEEREREGKNQGKREIGEEEGGRKTGERKQMSSTN